jgi:hypothetical protein
MHLAIGGLYLDRARTTDGLRELAAARQLDTRVLTCRSSKRSHTANSRETTRRPRGASPASTLNPNDAITAYVLARHLSRSGAAEDAGRAYDRFVAAEAPRLQGTSRNRRTVHRSRLFHETPGVEPFFPPALYVDGFASCSAATCHARSTVPAKPDARSTRRGERG